jgi:hypothetical protein
MLRRILALMLCAALPAPALAQTHTIAQLGTAPLIGQVASTPQLQRDVQQQQALFEEAGMQLGLTPAQFIAFEQRIENGQVAYVTIPRHLDAMSWRTGNRVHVLRDVVIPAHTMGWEIDLAEGNQILGLFIPNKCGNLSLLRRPAVHIARVMTPRVQPTPFVLAAQYTPPPTQPPTAAPAPAPTPLPYAAASMSSQPASPARHVRAWPLLLLVPVIAMLVSHGHSSPGSFGPIPASPSLGPTPPPAGCTPTPPP